MSVSSTERERWLARESNREEWRRLWAATELADDFQFFSVQLGDPQASTFVGELLAQHTRESSRHLCTIAIEPQTRVSTLLERFRRAPQPRVSWLVSDATGPKLERLFLLLNQKREVISSLCEGPLLLGLHPLAWASFRRCAPDFWSVHQAVFRFSPGRDVSLERPLRRPGLLAPWPQSSIEDRLTPSHWRIQGEDLQAQQGMLFVGRESELSLLGSVLQEPGVRVLITGPSGIGKTALVRAVLSRVAKRHTGGVWVIPLDPRAPSARSYAAAVLERLLIEMRPGVPAPTELSALRRHFESASRSSRALFVFEDLEDPELLPLLLPGSGSSAIVTSRRALDRAPFEHVVALGGLSMNAATELLSHVHEAPEPELRRVAVQARGVPFELRRVSRSLVLGGDGDPTLETWSDDARALWAKLGLFSGVFSLDDAVTVSGWDLEQVRSALDELVDRALIDPQSADLYRNHERLRARAIRLLSEQPDHARAQRAFARRVLVDRPVPPEDPNFRAAEAWLRSQLDGSGLPDEDWAILRAAALGHATRSTRVESLMKLAETVAQTRGDRELLAAIYRYRANRTYEQSEAKIWRKRELDALLEAGGSSQPAVVRTLLALAELSDGQSARHHAERAVQISDELDDLELRVRSRLAQADAADTLDVSRALLEQALELATLGGLKLRSAVYWSLAKLDRAAGDLDGARAWLEQSLELEDEPAVHYRLGEISEQAEELDRALESYRRALRGFDEAHDDDLRADVLSRLGQVSIARGDLDTAQHWLDRALEVDEQLGQAEFSLIPLARLDHLRGRLREAVQKLILAYEEVRLFDTSIAIEEMKAFYDAAESASDRAEMREQWEQAGLDWDDIVPDG